MEHVVTSNTNGNGHCSNGTGSEGSTLPAELTRLISVAIISRRFRDLLLHDPATALDDGFHGQQFSLTPEERNMVISIQAASLTDFAAQLAHLRAGTRTVGTTQELTRRPLD